MSGGDTLYLVDGSSYLYRAFHALPPLSNSRGEPTGAVVGVLNMLLRFLKDEHPERIAVVFDAPGRTFRDDLFEAYKAHRPPMPDELRAQVQPLLEAVQALGLPVLRLTGVEADDVIGTLTAAARAQGLGVRVSTGDKDMAQLVVDGVTLVNTMTNTVMDRDGVKAKFDVWPEQVIDYLALVGDTSDNIPGIPKVGPKTAAKWLGQYGTLDNLLANAAEVPGKVGESLREHQGLLPLSKQLATIRCDVELGVPFDTLRRGEPDRPALHALFTKLELRSLARQFGDGDAEATPAAAPTAGAGLPAGAPPAGAGSPATPTDLPPDVPREYDTVFTWPALDAWLERLRAAPAFAFDTETTSLDYMVAEVVGVSFADAPGKAAYVPLAHAGPGAPDQLPRAEVLEKLRPLLEDASRPKVMQHGKYDMHVLQNHGLHLRGITYDTMLESYVLDSTATRHDMDSMAAKYLGITTIKFEDVAGKGAKQLTFDQVPVDTASTYAAEDADVTLRLHATLWPRLAAEPTLAAVYTGLECPLIPVLQAMERRGVRVDPALLAVQSQEIAKRMQQLEGEAHAAAGQPFNLESPKQLQHLLFEKLGIPVVRKTPTGQPSTAEDVLEELAEEHALPRLILEHRGLAKLRGTYTEKLPLQINATTGRIHTSYHQAVAATGRLSSTDPNLQNIPIRTPEGRRIRQAFVAPPGHVLMAADYSQIELRIMAHLSGDEGLLAAFAEDRDVHQATAAEVFGVAREAVTGDQRRAAKAINFGLIYGMSAFGLAKQIGVDRGAAQQYVDLYFARYPGVKRYMDETRKAAREQGWVETVLGRRLYLPEIRSRNRQMQQYAERSAINAPMQGTAADIIKRAMIDVEAWLGPQGEAAPARLIMQVHDELVLEVRADAVDAVREGVRERMVAAAQLRVPLKVEVGTGANWDEAH
jgi:DNA polymerase I